MVVNNKSYINLAWIFIVWFNIMLNNLKIENINTLNNLYKKAQKGEKLYFTSLYTTNTSIEPALKQIPLLRMFTKKLLYSTTNRTARIAGGNYWQPIKQPFTRKLPNRLDRFRARPNHPERLRPHPIHLWSTACFKTNSLLIRDAFHQGSFIFCPFEADVLALSPSYL